MTTPINDSLVEKIRKLLALSKSNHEGEADAALCKAKELAIRNGIDIASINLKDTQIEPVTIERGISLGQRKNITLKFSAWILESHFNVKIIYHGNRATGRSMSLIGTKTDIEMAKFVQSFLKETFFARWHVYYAKMGCDLKLRESYLFGLYRGIMEKLEETKKQTETQVFGEMVATKGLEQVEAVKQNWGLMLFGQKERLEKAQAEFFPKLGKPVHVRRTYRSDAIEHGREEGRKINIARPIGYNVTNQIS